MTMHHTTRKKAHDAGLEVTETQQADGSYLYQVTDQRIDFVSDDPKAIVAAAILFNQISPPKEYPFVSAVFDEEEYSVSMEHPEEDVLGYTADNIEDAWVGFTEEYADQINEAADEVEDEDEGGSIVPQKYRDEYKARGDATRCGDVFCEYIDPLTRFPNEKGKMVADLEATRAVALANGIEKDWPNLNKGQRCMNWRNMIRAKVKKTGQLVLPAALMAGEKEDKVITFDQWLPDDETAEAA